MPTSRIILGIDEVGRGPWAGPLVIGAVILPHPYPDWADSLADSKKLPPKRRKALAKIILKESPATALGWVSAREIDANGLSDSLKLATRRAVRQIQQQNVPFTEIIIDGNQNFLAHTPLAPYTTTIIKADDLIKEVSAASIIAKVARDHYMAELSKIYPDYGFERHVGYGTAAHKAALQDLGPTPEHRFFTKPIQNYISQLPPSSIPPDIMQRYQVGYLTNHNLHQSVVKNTTLTAPAAQTVVKNTTLTGSHAESVVADYLQAHGHTIIARNHKTPSYEIDIISVDAEKIYFTEVKYRHNSAHGTPLDAITPKKQQQMHYAATAFLKYSNISLQPILAAAAVSGPDFHLDSWFPIS